MLLKFLRDDKAQAMVEYALIIALASIVAMTALKTMGSKANTTLNNASQSFPQSQTIGEP